MSLVLGDTVPCRTCEGRGELRSAMTPPEQKERSRELRIAKREGYSLGRMSPVKPCRECGGRGYIPVSEADAKRPRKAVEFEGERPLAMWE